MKRSQFIKSIFHGAAAAAIMPAFSFCSSDSSGNKMPGNFNINPDFSPDVDVELTAAPAELQILSGKKTNVSTYHVNVLTENNAIVENIPGSYLGPVHQCTG